MPNTIIAPNVAANAYAKNSSIGQNMAVGGKDNVNFSDILRAKAADSIEVIKASEKVSAQAIKGKSDMIALVQAVTNAEITLESVVKVRDRMLSAYQEIMRMPI